jgi:hypothetical protein
MINRRLGFAAAQETGQVAPPIVYVREDIRWEYKTVGRDLSAEVVIGEAELNALGAEGWELAGILTHEGKASFYFKRMAT